MNADCRPAPAAAASMSCRLMRVCACVLVMAAGACAPRTVDLQPALPPAHPEFTYPVVPDTLRRTAAVPHHDRGWQLLQRDDRPAAAREFAAALQREPGFYPALAARGYVALADTSYTQALESFDAALARDPGYLPALVGRGRALLALDRLDAAAAAFDAAVEVDPSVQPLRDRVEVLRVRQLQTLIEQARSAAAARRVGEARQAYTAAIAGSPESTFLHRELAALEREAGDEAAARRHLTRAVEIDPGDRAAWIALGGLLEGQQDVTAALQAYSEAAAIEPSDDLQARIDRLTRQARDAQLPAEFRTIQTRSPLTRGDLAALIGVRFDALLEALPDTPVVLTDGRDHWAAPWIARVVSAGVMEPLANHTFQPASPVRRIDLAEVTARLLRLVRGTSPGAQPVTVPVIADLQPTHLSFPAVSAVVAAGIMPLLDGQQFQGTRPATGAEASAALERLRALSPAGR